MKTQFYIKENGSGVEHIITTETVALVSGHGGGVQITTKPGRIFMTDTYDLHGYSLLVLEDDDHIQAFTAD